MTKTFTIAAILVALHGLIHLIGMTVYMKLMTLEAFAYKTSILGGSWDLGEEGIRLFGMLWGVAAIGFLAAAGAMLLNDAWGRPLLFAVTILSLLLCTLDWNIAFAGIAIDVLILIGILLWPHPATV